MSEKKIVVKSESELLEVLAELREKTELKRQLERQKEYGREWQQARHPEGGPDVPEAVKRTKTVIMRDGQFLETPEVEFKDLVVEVPEAAQYPPVERLIAGPAPGLPENWWRRKKHKGGRPRSIKATPAEFIATCIELHANRDEGLPELDQEDVAIHYGVDRTTVCRYIERHNIEWPPGPTYKTQQLVLPQFCLLLCCTMDSGGQKWQCTYPYQRKLQNGFARRRAKKSADHKIRLQ